MRLDLFWEKPRPTWESDLYASTKIQKNSGSNEAAVLTFVSMFSMKRDGGPSRLLLTCFPHFCRFSWEQKRSHRQIQGTDTSTDSFTGLFSMVAGSHSSLSSRSLRLLVSDFTSSGQRVKLAALVSAPSLPFFHGSSCSSVMFYNRLSLCEINASDGRAGRGGGGVLPLIFCVSVKGA